MVIQILEDVLCRVEDSKRYVGREHGWQNYRKTSITLTSWHLRIRKEPVQMWLLDFRAEAEDCEPRYLRSGTHEKGWAEYKRLGQLMDQVVEKMSFFLFNVVFLLCILFSEKLNNE